MANKINFVTGETYTLSELFSGERKIIIPDLQRDYCWGGSATDSTELVTNFVDNLLQQYKSDRSQSLNLGLIYGYEEPAHHIQLCDGQQRITTLYLLIGMINRYSTNNRFRHRLISDYNYNNNNNEPYLQYAIRESSLYFLSDLVCEFFIRSDHKTDKVADICTQNKSWYFHDYEVDPSIKSMLSSLSIMEQKLTEESYEGEQAVVEFGDYLVDKLTFMYYDMESRKNGEETFVIINTSGEPLSATQNLKPLILNAEINRSCANIAMRWEQIETWFWKNKAKDTDTADAGFEEFLRWLTLITYAKNKNDEIVKTILLSETYTFSINELSFDDVYSYWGNVKDIVGKTELYSHDFLFPTLKKNKRILSQIDCFKLLPVILYVHKFPEACAIDIERVYRLFENLSRYQSINVDNKSIFYAVDAINRMPNKDIASLLSVDSISRHILTEEEECKLKIEKDNPQREAIEKAFWTTQDKGVIASHEIWMGQIAPLIEWSMDDGIFDFEKFQRYTNIFDKVFNGECKDNIDITRRALLTRGLKEYPRIFRGNTNWSFGWEWIEWAVLIRDNQEEFKLFFDVLLTASNMDVKQQEMIDAFQDRSSWWSIFITSNNYLAYCGYKYIQRVGTDIIRLLSKGNTRGDYKYLYGWQEVKSSENWTSWENSGLDCLCADHQTYNIAIILLVEPQKAQVERFKLRLFNQTDDKRLLYDLTGIACHFFLNRSEDGQGYISDSMTSQACYGLCEAIRTELRDMSNND